MDLVGILESRVESLPEGSHVPGLRAVLRHVEVALDHLSRGQRDGNDTAFTDAIYRTNQAFEGSLKEAYRVLAGKEPAKATNAAIEAYLEKQKVLRPRVLAQLANYRKEWRNPSAHDYQLDFDEDEALLAIVSVSAFAIVLVDQILEHIAFEQAKALATEQHTTVSSAQPLIDRVAQAIKDFTLTFDRKEDRSRFPRTIAIVSGLAGYLSETYPDLSVLPGAELSTTGQERRAIADLVVASPTEKLIVEFKLLRGGLSNHQRIDDGLHQLAAYMEISGIPQSILYVISTPSSETITKITMEEMQPLFGKGRILVLATEPAYP